VKSWTYNREIQTLVEQFAGAFNDIIVKRFDKNEIIQSQNKVRFVYAPKQRVLESLRTPAPGGITIPAIAINISSIQRDSSRVFNKNSGFEIQARSIAGEDKDFLKFIRQPVPINVGINMSIITKYQTDMDQILSNFIPYCDPYIVISWKLPVGYNKDYEIRSEVLWSGGINVTYPLELPPNQSFRITADTSFTIKGWLFKSTQYHETLKKIYYINTDFVSVDENGIYSNDLITDLEQYETVTLNISARPHIHCVHPLIIPQNKAEIYNENQLIFVTGQFLSYTRAIYLSASRNDMFDVAVPTLFSPFSGLSALEPHYPSFYGYNVPTFTLIDDNVLSFSLPYSSINQKGEFDVIIENEAGYRSLIKETSDRFSGYNDAVSYSKYSPAALSGIRIV
jgi:hypothetical protein